MTDEVKERKRDWKKDDVAQIKNRKHPYFPLFVTITDGGYPIVKGYIHVLDETAKENNVVRTSFWAADLAYIGVAEFVEDDTRKPEPVGLYQGLSQINFS